MLKALALVLTRMHSLLEHIQLIVQYDASRFIRAPLRAKSFRRRSYYFETAFPAGPGRVPS